MKTKNIFILLLVGIQYSLSFGQASQGLEIKVPPSPIDSNTSFDIELRTTGTTPPGCTSRTITLNIGLLSYQGSNNQNGISINKNIVDGITTLTISNILSNSGGEISAFGILVKFPQNTCNNTSVAITGVLSANDCSSVFSDVIASPVSVTTRTLNYAKANIVEEKSNNPANNIPVCFGKIVKYTISAKNYGTNTYTIDNAKVDLKIASCAQIVGVYDYSTYNPVSFTTGNSNGITKNIEWNFLNNSQKNQLDPTAFSSSPIIYDNAYDVYVKYPCQTCTPELYSKPRVNIKGTTCEGNFETQNQPDDSENSVNTKFSGVDCSASECLTGGIPPVISLSSGSFLPCVTTCITPFIHYNIDVRPSQNTYSDLVFQISIPIGLNITSPLTSYPSNICKPPVVEYFDGNRWLSSPSTSVHTSSVRWSFSCNEVSAIRFRQLGFYFRYNNVSPDTKFNINYSLKSGDTIISDGISNLSIAECSYYLNIDASLKDANNNQDYFKEVNSIPGNIITHRLSLVNLGNSTSPSTVIEDIINPNTEFMGGFKCVYNNIDYFPSGNTITIPDLGTATIILPDIGSSGKVNLSGFKIPVDCIPGDFNNTNFNVIFNVKVRSVPFGTKIPNVFKVNNLITNETIINVKSSTQIKLDMFAKCPSKEEWSNTSLKVKNGEKVDFKMRVTNTGSNSVKLSELINLKPLKNDKYELGATPRNVNSNFIINYECANPSILSNIQNIPTAGYKYAKNNVDMDRTMLCPPSGSGNAPVWEDQSTCGVNSNWFKTEFAGGLTIAPGDYIEIIYKGKVLGGIGTSINSFSIKLINDDGTCSYNSDQAKITIINDGVGCEGIVAPPCVNCTSFDLLKNETYLVSGWVKESDDAKPLEQLKKYENAYISVSFTNVSGNLITPPQNFYASGEIIDGWQRIIGQFVVPDTVDDMKLELVNANTSDTGSKMVYFDDIRVLPTKGNMKSFVYDQKTQRLMAELDENNYATFYEYDLEGGLIRVKKETEKGVFTIQETRSGNTKTRN
jgi:hypothetical protein